MRPIIFSNVAAAGALTLLGLAMAASAPITTASAQAQTRQCFRAQDWMGTSAGGPRDLYVRIGMKDVWHLGMAQDCPGARYPGAVRISDTVSGGSNEICSGVDLQIKVAPQGSSNSTYCIVREIDKLSPDQIKALPRKAVP